jgi:hypothetical protein
MAACNQIIGYPDDLPDPTACDDYGPNGLQVPGSEQIQTVVTDVSANAELFSRARERAPTSCSSTTGSSGPARLRPGAQPDLIVAPTRSSASSRPFT